MTNEEKLLEIINKNDKKNKGGDLVSFIVTCYFYEYHLYCSSVICIPKNRERAYDTYS